MGTWLGEATDVDITQTNPGLGYDYGWSMNPTYNGTMEQAITNENTTSVTSTNGIEGQALNSGIYLPIENFNALLGTPLNGEWTITVVDNLGRVRAYNVFVETNRKSTKSVVGGARKRAAYTIINSRRKKI